MFNWPVTPRTPNRATYRIPTFHRYSIHEIHNRRAIRVFQLQGCHCSLAGIHYFLLKVRSDAGKTAKRPLHYNLMSGLLTFDSWVYIRRTTIFRSFADHPLPCGQKWDRVRFYRSSLPRSGQTWEPRSRPHLCRFPASRHTAGHVSFGRFQLWPRRAVH